MSSLYWLTSQTENIFDSFSRLCGVPNGTIDEVEELPSNAEWSGLEYELSQDEESHHTEPERIEERCSSLRSRGSNLPVLRELPSFGSTLASNSLHSGAAGSYGRSRSIESQVSKLASMPKVPLCSRQRSQESEGPLVTYHAQAFNVLTPPRKSQEGDARSGNTFIFLEQ